ncbi:MAG: DUF1624 domain-containing protein [Phycisphaerae bacterium]
MMESGKAKSDAIVPNLGIESDRLISIDVARGLIMMIMALDHASVTWNEGRSAFEAGLPPIETVAYSGLAQQITREVTHICAPGFQLLAGLGLALSVGRRQERGVNPWRISADMALRAGVLFFCEWVLLHLAMGRVWFFFGVLCCIGSSMLLFSVLRFLPRWLIGVGSLGVLLAAPYYCPQRVVDPSAGQYLANVWTTVALPSEQMATAWWVLYPVLPWVGIFGLGWFWGAWYADRSGKRLAWLTAAGIGIFLAGVLLRWFGGAYGDRLPGGEAGPWSARFWALSKYPPTPAFSMMTLGVMLALLGALRPLDYAQRLHRLWRAPVVFGRVALFFYLIHFYLYGAYPVLSGTFQGHSLATTWIVWLVGLGLLWPVCRAYGRARQRHPAVLRYF